MCVRLCVVSGLKSDSDDSDEDDVNDLESDSDAVEEEEESDVDAELSDEDEMDRLGPDYQLHKFEIPSREKVGSTCNTCPL